MATIASDTSKINRTSVFKGILDLYYSKAPAGGAFSAYDSGKNTMIKGVTAPYGFTQKSVEYTVEPGFGVGANTGTENFNSKALNYSDKTSNGPVLKTGVNKISTNWNGNASLQDALYTKDPGFRLQTSLGASQFKDVAGQRSLELSRYVKGFNDKKYTNGSFTR
jgi:hypothetical protein